MVLAPDQFQVNEAWIAFKLNEAPVVTAQDGDFHVLALMDAASCFILGAEFVPAESMELGAVESKRLLETGKAHKDALPKTLILPHGQAAETLGREAERLGVTITRVADEELSVFVDEAREGFQAHVGGGRIQ